MKFHSPSTLITLIFCLGRKAHAENAAKALQQQQQQQQQQQSIHTGASTSAATSTGIGLGFNCYNTTGCTKNHLSKHTNVETRDVNYNQ